LQQKKKITEQTPSYPALPTYRSTITQLKPP